MRIETSGTRITRAAVVATQNAPFTIEEVNLAPPQADEVIVELEASGMCHADLAAQAGKMPFPLPGVLGHEGVGRIVETGSEVSGLDIGQRVVISFTFCGHCEFCLDAKPAYCSKWPILNLVGGGRADGSQSLSHGGCSIHSHFFGQSSFSKYVATAARGVVAVPDDVPASVLAPMGCGVQTGVCAATDVLKPRAGDRVAVFGAGAVGMSALMGLALTGATQIIAIDLHPQRLSLARELGATDVIDATGADVAAEIARLTDGKGLSGAIETSGNLKVLESAIGALAPAGTCVVIGAPNFGDRASFDVIDVIARGLRIVGTNQGDANPRTVIPRLIELYRQGRLPIDKLVTTFAFDKINEASEASHKGSAIKPVLLME